MLSIHLHVAINNEHMNMLIKLVESEPGLPKTAEAWSDNLHTNPLNGVILLSKPT
jgi:hypothetical protein